MASAARQGMAISSATLDHISALNLFWEKLSSALRGHRWLVFLGGVPTVRINGPICSSCPHPTRCDAPGSSGSEDGN